METRSHETQVFMLRVWNGPASAFRAAVRRVDEAEWTPLVTPAALADYARRIVPCTASTLKIYTLGGFRLLFNEAAPAGGYKAQKRCLELLKALLAFGARDVCERRLADALWPDAEADRARQNLKATLHRLRNLVGAPALTMRDGRLSLVPERCWVDAWELEERLDTALDRTATADAQRCTAALQAALALYRGAFLANDDLPFALLERERLRNKLLRALSCAVERLGAGGQHETSVALIERGLEIDPLDERLYELLMEALLTQGRRCEALAGYERCARQMRGAFGLNPSKRLESLRRRAAALPLASFDT